MKVGFIGAGNMATAILTGIAKAGALDKKDVYVSNRSKAKLDRIAKDFSFETSTDNKVVLKKEKDVVFLCVKPQIFDEIKDDLKKHVGKEQLIVSIMAGKSIDYIKKALGVKKVVRVMPNTPCLVGAGISSFTPSEEAKKDKNLAKVHEILESIGEVLDVEEKYVNAVTQVAGASPAWIFMMIEALADGGVMCGLPRDMAYRLAKASVYGSGKLAIEKGSHPGVLKDMVTSPAGTTIEGVKVLEDKGFRGALIDAVVAAYEKTKKL